MTIKRLSYNCNRLSNIFQFHDKTFIKITKNGFIVVSNRTWGVIDKAKKFWNRLNWGALIPGWLRKEKP